MRRSQGKTKKDLFGRDEGGGSQSGLDKIVAGLDGSSGKSRRLSHRAYEIIPRNSPYGHHFRTLLNAENFVSQKEYEMALDIYQRLLNKIQVRSSREKIEENINDIQNFMEDEDLSTPPKLQVDLRLGGALPGQGPQAPTPDGQPGAPGGASGAPPIQIQLSHTPFPAQPGAQPPPPPQQEAPASHPMPFGFFAQQEEDPETAESIKEAKQRADEGDFFEQKKESISREEGLEILEDNKESVKHLKDISESVFNIEKALFETERMKVDSEEAPQMEGGEEEERQRGSAPSSEKVAGSTGEAGSPVEGAAPAIEEEEGAIEEEEKSEGVLERQDAIPALDTDGEMSDEEGEEKEAPEVQEIRGVLELREPEQEDTPFITITYDFDKIPHHFFLSKDHNILEYAYYKYKPMLVKAQKFIKKKQITKALNYYRVIRDQQIPDTLRVMVDRNIQDIAEYLEKYLMSRPV